ncbi:hypothetical protein E2C01_051100 [Portunus trituberculatus]|uniref:Uncharacterized protein n=1 Tax=Portunus trituberculatus TaxID=210409 RepID=A0A5B7GHQ4_PORTR|nr:hypothetical protein [Portunus trituberculatus]
MWHSHLETFAPSCSSRCCEVPRVDAGSSVEVLSGQRNVRIFNKAANVSKFIPEFGRAMAGGSQCNHTATRCLVLFFIAPQRTPGASDGCGPPVK